jgi:dihydropyrimidinase
MAESPVYIVHLSCTDALNQVREARDRGIAAFAETCPQYLFHSIEDYGDDFDGAKYVMTPPLREKHNQAELWKGLKMDDLQVISTDHCPFCMKEQKELGVDDFSKIPNGAPGVENRMSLIYNGGVVENRVSLNRFVELTSTAAAKMFGLFPKKGTIAVGSDADIVIFDAEREHTFGVAHEHMNVDYSSYEGWKVKINQKMLKVSVGGAEFKQLFKNIRLRPAGKAFVDCIPVAIFARQQSPLRSRTGNPQNGFEKLAALVFLSDINTRASFQKRQYFLPLFIG